MTNLLRERERSSFQRWTWNVDSFNFVDKFVNLEKTVFKGGLWFLNSNNEEF